MNSKKISVISLILLLCIIGGSFSFAESQKDDKEKAIELYFLLEQEKALHQDAISLLELEMDQIEKKIQYQSQLMAKKKALQNDLLDTYGLLLRRQQTNGTYHLLTKVLNAKSIKDVIKTMNEEKALSQKVSEVFLAIQEEMEAMDSLALSMDEERKLFERKVQTLREVSLAYERQLGAQEKIVAPYLNSTSFLETVSRLLKDWEAVQPTFKRKIEAFNLLIQNQVLPESIFDLRRNGLKWVATLDEKRFNEALKGQSSVADMSFDFSTKGVEIYFDSIEVKLMGTFELKTPQNIAFSIKDVYFKDHIVSVLALEHFLKGIRLQFDLTDMLGKSTIERIEVKHGEIILTIQLKLF